MADEIARRQERMPMRRGQAMGPYRAMREMMDSIFEDMFSDWPMMRVRPFEWRMEQFTPIIDVIDEENRIRVEAEVPGMNPEDLELTVAGDSLILKGEKKEEKEEQEKGMRYRERSFGSFQRVIPLPGDIEKDKVEARFKNGVLHVILPKSAQAMERAKKIQIRSEGGEQEQSISTQQQSGGGK
jgi:HSP20 family protein